MICELCGRDNVETTVHHLTPKEEGGKHMPTALLCISCHKQVHALYSNKELAIRLNTIPHLQSDEQIRKYLKWVRKQSPTSIPVVRKRKNVHSR